MQQIFSHIAYLLTKHECVVIPEFGALVHHYNQAKYAYEDEIFAPPSISLGFNPDLKHNDGLLSDLISKERLISFNEGNKILSNFSDKLNSLINNSETVIIPQVGQFYLDTEKKVIFHPVSDSAANAIHIGLKNFYLPLLSDIGTSTVSTLSSKEEVEIVENQSEDKDIVMIRLSKRLLSYAAAAIIVIGMVLFSTPLSNREVPKQYASMFLPISNNYEQVESKSFIKEDLKKEIQPVNEIKAKPKVIEVTAIEKSNQLSETKVEVKTTVKPAEIIIDKKETAVVKHPANTPVYYIIIGSFPTKADAEKVLPKYQQQGFNSVSIVEKSNRARISIKSFQNKSEAEAFLSSFRTDHPEHKNAWLLSSNANI